MQDASNFLGYFECTKMAAFDSEVAQIFRKMQNPGASSLKLPGKLLMTFTAATVMVAAAFKSQSAN